MGKSKTGTPGKGQFIGIGRQKSPRRRNAATGRVTPRKRYADVRKEQRGTWMEPLIRARAGEMEGQYNSNPALYGKRMSQRDATGQLSSAWETANKDGMSGRNIAKYMNKNDVSAGAARRSLIGISEVSFSDDPKSR